MWIYLNPFCLHARVHRPLAEYGPTANSIMTSAREYHRAWTAGEYNPDIAPEFRPGYRPPERPKPAARKELPMRKSETPRPPEAYPPPLVRATEIGLLQRDSGKYDLDLRPWPGARTPPGALKALAALASHVAGTTTRIVLTYARGYVPNDDGSPRRAPVWENVKPEENDGRSKIKTGEHPAEPADLIRITLSADRLLAYGNWINAKPDSFGARSPDGRYMQSLPFTPWLERLKSWPTT